jgi:hypothetical protein
MPRFSLAKLLGIVTLTAFVLAAGAQFGSLMGFVSLLAVYGAVVIAALSQIGRSR